MPETCPECKHESLFLKNIIGQDYKFECSNCGFRDNINISKRLDKIIRGKKLYNHIMDSRFVCQRYKD